MLNTLLSQYSYIRHLIDTFEEEDQTAAYVKSKIQIAEMKTDNKDEQGSSGASTWIATAYAAQGNDSKKRSGKEINWLLDCGCTDHIVHDEKYFENSIVLKEPVNIYLGDNRYLKATKIGNVVSFFDAFGKKNEVNMSNVFYAKDMNTNLIIFRKLTDNNKIISKGDIAKIIDKENKLIAVAYKENRTYKITSELKYEEKIVNCAECNNIMSSKKKWHRMLGHINFGYLNTLFIRRGTGT